MGRGAFGRVWEAVDTTTDEKVAIKQITITGNQEEEEFQIKSLLREIEILQKLSSMPGNTYTIKLREVFTPCDTVRNSNKIKEVCIVTDYYDFDLGSLLDRVSQPITEKQALSLIH